MYRIRFVGLWGITVNVQDTVCGVVGSHRQCAGYGFWSCGESPLMCRIRFVEFWGVTVNVQDTVCGVLGSHC